MRIIFDENIPEGLDQYFVGCQCSHLLRMGWSGIKNGSLLTLMEENEFQVFMTYDSGIPHQHNLVGRKIAIFVLKPEGQGVQAILALIPKILGELAAFHEGEIKTISNRSSQI